MPDTLAAQQILVDAQRLVLDERRGMLDEGRGAELVEMMKEADGFLLTQHSFEYLRRPKRIQRKRAKGWTMPDGVVYVGRPTKWGNPFAAWTDEGRERAIRAFRGHITGLILIGACDVSELRGKDLACWCPLDKPCHADVLLELANAPEGKTPA